MVETLANRHFRMTKRYITVMLIILGFQTDACAQKNEEIFTIYLVRHSEKNLASDSPSDPPLTLCGEQRSESLNSFLSAVALDAIYSTNYNRTESTALPTATSKGLEIKEYDSGKLKEFSTLLLENKQDALVVGHSNTTGVLAGLLVDEELGEFDLDIYNRVYQVVVYGDSGRLHLLHTAFDCND
jgi:broad specificity phosphatase PhoE